MSEKIMLKDGSVVADSRFDRIEQFDERSRSFSVTDIINKKYVRKQRSYTWKCFDHLNQGVEGSCAGHALAHVRLARPNEVLGVTHNDAVDWYHLAQRIDPWPGGSYPGAVPIYEGTSILAIVKIGKQLGHYASYHWSFGLEPLITGIGYTGPAILGIPVFMGMSQIDSRGFIHPTGELLGGHAILCKGVNIKGEYFILHNSWGVDWGIRGDCKVSFSDMQILLKQNGEAVFVVGKNKK